MSEAQTAGDNPEKAVPEEAVAIPVPGVARFVSAPRVGDRQLPKLVSISELEREQAAAVSKDLASAQGAEQTAASPEPGIKRAEPGKAVAEPVPAPPVPACQRAEPGKTVSGSVPAPAKADRISAPGSVQELSSAAEPDKAKPRKAEADRKAAEKAGKYDHEAVYQYYSPLMFERIRSELQFGTLDARMQAVRLYDIINAPDERQQEVLGRVYAEPRAYCLRMHKVGRWLYAIAFLASVFLLRDYAPFYIAAASYFFWCAYKDAKADSRGAGVYVLGLVALALFAFWRPHQPLLILFAAYSIAVLIWPYYLFGQLRSMCVRLLCNDYSFFKYATGRPNGSPDRPPVCLTKTTEYATVTVNWDINPNPPLTDMQIDSPYPVVIGHDYGFYFSLFHTRLFSFVIAWALALCSGKMVLWHAFAVALGLALLYSLAAPSQQFAEYKKKRRETYERGSRLTVYVGWLAKYTLWQFFCLAFMAVLLQHVLPVMSPHIEKQLDEYFPSWRYITNGLLQLFGLG